MTLPEGLATGDLAIDDQHGRILQAVRELRGALDPSPGLLAVTDYLTLHFEGEERLAREVEYPELHQHHMAHLDLFERWTHLRALWRRNGEVYQSIYIDRITGWLADHVLTHDMRLAAWIRERRP
jgi:hemerythrin-like metal-binding protein